MQQGLSVANIAERLGRHRSTLYRELDRNRCHVTDGAYRPSKAQRRTRARRSRSRRNRHYSDNDFLLIRKLLRLKWSPDQIVGHMRRFKLTKKILAMKPFISIYGEIKSMAAISGLTLDSPQKSGVSAIEPMIAEAN